jgi:hypothetical protein
MPNEEVKIPNKEELLGSTEKTEQASEPEYTEIEQRALEQGWKPKDKWQGDPDQHRSAREYLDRGELLGKIKSQSTQLDEIKRALVGMGEHNKRVYQAGYESALKELKQQKLAALEDNDTKRVLEIDDQIDATKDAIRQIRSTPPAVAPGPSEVTKQWMADNEWYVKDTAMRHVANGIASDFGRANPGATEQQLYDFLDKEIRKELPEKFKRKAAPSPDGEGRQVNGGSGNKGGTSFEKLLDSMTEDQARIARTLVKSGAITKEKYVEDFNAMNG